MMFFASSVAIYGFTFVFFVSFVVNRHSPERVRKQHFSDAFLNNTLRRKAFGKVCPLPTLYRGATAEIGCEKVTGTTVDL